MCLPAFRTRLCRLSSIAGATSAIGVASRSVCAVVRRRQPAAALDEERRGRTGTRPPPAPPARPAPRPAPPCDAPRARRRARPARRGRARRRRRLDQLVDQNVGVAQPPDEPTEVARRGVQGRDRGLAEARPEHRQRRSEPPEPDPSWCGPSSSSLSATTTMLSAICARQSRSTSRATVSTVASRLDRQGRRAPRRRRGPRLAPQQPVAERRLVDGREADRPALEQRSRQGVDRPDLAGLQLDLGLAQRQARVPGADLALVERQLDLAAARSGAAARQSALPGSRRPAKAARRPRPPTPRRAPRRRRVRRAPAARPAPAARFRDGRRSHRTRCRPP